MIGQSSLRRSSTKTLKSSPLNGTFLCINPNSLQLEEAERFLEVISENYYSLFEGKNEKSNLIFKDLSMYPNSDPDGYVYVDTDSEIFKSTSKLPTRPLCSTECCPVP